MTLTFTDCFKYKFLFVYSQLWFILPILILITFLLKTFICNLNRKTFLNTSFLIINANLITFESYMFFNKVTHTMPIGLKQCFFNKATHTVPTGLNKYGGLHHMESVVVLESENSHDQLACSCSGFLLQVVHSHVELANLLVTFERCLKIKNSWKTKTMSFIG